MWPTDADSLTRAQEELGRADPTPWSPGSRPLLLGGAWACFPRGLTGPGSAGDPVWGAAVALREGRPVASRVAAGRTDAGYVPGLLALRMGRVLDAAVSGLRTRPDLLLLDATARDHPRRCGLAWHLGAELDLPTVGVTHRPLGAEGDWPADRRGGTSLLRRDGRVVGCWVRARPGTRPLAVHPGWRVPLDLAVAVVLDVTGVRRTPEPLRWARQQAREARAGEVSPDRGSA